MIVHSHLMTLTSMMTIFFSATTVRGFSPYLKSPLFQRGGSSRRTIAAATANPICAAVLNHGNNIGSTSSTSSRTKNTKLFSTTSPNETSEKEKTPITLLAGFLGSGKTTTLQNLLTNNEGVKIGVIVNDVANVNIDSKLISNPNVISGEETVELQNGCACCSLADELIESVRQLTNDGERELDHIVIELSGVADPEAVKRNWKSALMVCME